MNVSATVRIVFHLLVIVLGILLPSKGMAGYWEDQFSFPEEFQSVPGGVSPPDWSKPVNLAGVLQLRDDLGRQQAEQLDRLARRLGDSVGIGLYSIDRAGPSWTPEYIANVRSERNIQLPIFEISPPALKDFFRGFQPKPAEIYPQIRLFGANRRLLGRWRGVQTAERIEQLIAEARKALGPWMDPLPEPRGSSLLANGDFEMWTEGSGHEGWIANPNPLALPPGSAPRRGWNASKAMEIRAATSGESPVIYQTLSSSVSLAGKRLRLSAAVQTNCIAQPIVGLAVAHPQEAPPDRFVPHSPFKTKSGAQVPMRILGALDYREEFPSWNWKSLDFDYPTETPIPVELLNPTVFIFLGNPKDSGGAALVDEVRLEVLD